MSSFKEFDHIQIQLEQIKTATNNFSEDNLIGRGGFVNVYKGQLLWSGQLLNIAVRRLNCEFGPRDVEFLTEISMLYRLNHENIVSIIGFCKENGEKIIVCKHKDNASLDKHLSGPTLSWLQRLKICVGVARALSCIHYDVKKKYGVIHRNIKSSKILLDENWEAKISGFQISIVNPATRKHRLLLSPVCGTYGYIDPIYVKTGGVTYKSDSYSFGIVLFEVLCGRLSVITKLEDEKRFLARLAKLHYDERRLDEIIDPDLRKQMDLKSLSIFSETAYQCLKEQRAQRPDMDQILKRLEKALDFQLKLENPEPSVVAVQGLTSNHLKGKNMEHLKIPLKEIKLATEDFDEKHRIGGGGFGIVYKAELKHFDKENSLGIKGELPKKESTVAIKRISSRQDRQGEEGFSIEIDILTRCKHPNVVSLLGFCDEDPEMILVYEHAYNGSLDDYLESTDYNTNLTWTQRLQVCIDIAHGLHYLHNMMEDDKERIIHRDIKSANILLRRNLEAMIADFGLSKTTPTSSLETRVAGTIVYLDPEYDSTRILRKESDIYSFGVVLFEILCGRLASDPIYTVHNYRGLSFVARKCFNEGRLKEMIDPRILNEIDQNIFTLNKGPNEDSLETFSKIAYRCLAETQAQRPKMEEIIEGLQKALDFQVNRVDILKVSHKAILLATDNFKGENVIGKGGFGDVYKGQVSLVDVAVKRHAANRGQEEQHFLMELDILFEYKHENIISLVGYCNEMDEKIILYEYAFHGSLDKHLNDAGLNWTKRLKICIDVASGLDFLHGGTISQERVIHRDIKSSNVLLSRDFKAKITDFGLSIITPINQEMDYLICNAIGTPGYIDEIYLETGVLTKECDIFALGVVLFEVMCGRLVCYYVNNKPHFLHDWFKRGYDEGKLHEIVFVGIKDEIVPQSLAAFSKIAYQCLQERKERPTAGEIVVQLKKALEFQEDYDIWEPKLPEDYKEIFQMSKSPEIYFIQKRKNLFDMLSYGILLEESKVWFSLSDHGERNAMISASTFSYGNYKSYKRRYIQKSRFHRAAKILDISNMKIHIRIKTQFLSPNITYGAHLVFKFCDPRKSSSKAMYVNLKYKLGHETLHAYFATWRDDEWMMIELCRFPNHKETATFEFLLESFSRHYCGSGAIYVEGIEFRAIDIVKHGEHEKSQVAFKSGSNMDRLYWPSEVNKNKCHMLPAKVVLCDTPNVKYFDWKPPTQISCFEVAELVAQVFHIKCNIETQMLLPNVDYACYLVFKLSRNCHELQCPVKVLNVHDKKNKEANVLYFRSPSEINLHGIKKLPEKREDGWMEVIVWQFSSRNKHYGDHHPMHLKLRCLEGTMSGLFLLGIEFRPM